MISKATFRELIEDFVAENFAADGCRECHEACYPIVPQDHKGSYDKAITELFNKMKFVVTDCKHLHADWCHHPGRQEGGQEKCISYFHQDECPDYEAEEK